MLVPLRCWLVALPVVFALSSCDESPEETGETDGSASEGDHDDDHDEETEQITIVTLTFRAEDGTTITASFEDPDGAGGASGSSEPITLAPDVSYELEVSFVNSLEDPAEDITEEIREEAEEHQVFLLGGISGPATASGDGAVHSYADMESDYGPNAAGEDLPVGLKNTLSLGPDATGSFDLRVILQHLPEVNGSPQKTEGLSQLLADGMGLPGDADADVTFSVSVE